MRYLLAPRYHSEVVSFAQRRILLAFDYDGTLSPIVYDPQAARMRDTTRALLKRVARQYPCAVLSGRSRSDVLRRVTGIPLVEVIGNHGMEWSEGVAPEAQRIRKWRPRLIEVLREIEGARIEDKGASITVHYRGARHPAHTERAVRRALGKLGAPVQAMHGKCSVNIVPQHAPTKGTALIRLIERYRMEGALFIGDDVTDEDAFAVEREHVVSARIRHSRKSRAQYYVKSQREIDVVLQLLLRARSGEERVARSA